MAETQRASDARQTTPPEPSEENIDRWVNALFCTAFEKNAAELMLFEEAGRLYFCCRIDGKLQQLMWAPLKFRDLFFLHIEKLFIVHGQDGPNGRFVTWRWAADRSKDWRTEGDVFHLFLSRPDSRTLTVSIEKQSAP